jgi:hypothetical protein
MRAVSLLRRDHRVPGLNGGEELRALRPFAEWRGAGDAPLDKNAIDLQAEDHSLTLDRAPLRSRLSPSFACRPVLTRVYP